MGVFWVRGGGFLFGWEREIGGGLEGRVRSVVAGMCGSWGVSIVVLGRGVAMRWRLLASRATAGKPKHAPWDDAARLWRCTQAGGSITAGDVKLLARLAGRRDAEQAARRSSGAGLFDRPRWRRQLTRLWKGLLDKIMTARQRLARGITRRWPMPRAAARRHISRHRRHGGAAIEFVMLNSRAAAQRALPLPRSTRRPDLDDPPERRTARRRRARCTAGRAGAGDLIEARRQVATGDCYSRARWAAVR